MNNFIEWSEIDLSKARAGKNKLPCPRCNKGKSDTALSVNTTTGLAKCHRCEAVSVRDKDRDFAHKKKEYKLPPQTWQNYTTMSDATVKWFKGRGISQRTLMDLKITEEKKYFPQVQKERTAVTFNYFDLDGTLVNKKFRDGKKNFTQVADAKKILYGLIDIIDADEVIFVEGEMDKASLYEADVKNVVSVPNGANDLDDAVSENWEIFNNEKPIVIAVDNDENGKKLEQSILDRFGRHRCFKVEWPEGCKDANDVLVQHGAIRLKSIVDARTEYPVDDVYASSDLEAKLMHIYENGFDESMFELKDPRWQTFNELYILFLGMLTVVTGVPTHGKSTWLENYVLQLLAEHETLKASFFSPEHSPVENHAIRLASKAIGKPFDKNDSRRFTRDELKEYIDWSGRRLFHVDVPSGKKTNWTWMVDKMKEQILRYGINIFVIDAFNKVRLDSERTTETQAIGDILQELTLFVQYYRVHIFVVAHPYKMEQQADGTFKVPTLYSIKGSSEWYAQVHNGITVYKNEKEDSTDVHVQKFKPDHVGGKGLASFGFDKVSKRVFDLVTDCADNSPLWVKGYKPSPVEPTFFGGDSDDDMPF